MKKVIAIVFVFVMMLSLFAGCKNTDSDLTKDNQDGENDKIVESKIDISDAVIIELDSDKAAVNGKSVEELDDDATLEDVLALLGMDNYRGERPNGEGDRFERPMI